MLLDIPKIQSYLWQWDLKMKLMYPCESGNMSKGETGKLLINISHFHYLQEQGQVLCVV
jgi:hypothetical protein